MDQAFNGGIDIVLEHLSPYVFASSRTFLDKWFPDFKNFHGRKLQDALFRSSLLLYGLYACSLHGTLVSTNSRIIFDCIIKSIAEDELKLIHTVADSRKNQFSELVENDELFHDIFICTRKGYSVNKNVNSLSEYVLSDYGKVAAGEMQRINDYFCYDLLKADSYMSVQHSVFFNGKMYFSTDNSYYKADLASQIYKDNGELDFKAVKKTVSEQAESVRFINESKLPDAYASYEQYDEYHKSKEYVFSSYGDEADYETRIKIDSEALVSLLKQDNEPTIRKILEGIKNGMDENGYLKTTYRKNFQGRYYCKGLSIQQLPSELRSRLFSEYAEIDMKCAIYTVLYNLALKFAIDGIPCITELAIHPDEKRNELFNKYKGLDPNLTQDYIKTFLTSLSYGANASPDYIATALSRSSMRCIPLDIDGYSDKLCPLALAEDEFIVSLIKEIRKVVKMLSKVFTEKRNGKRYLINLYGNALLLDRQATLGKRLAHMYQSIESTVLMKVLEYKDIAENAGLLLHDGLYIRKQCISKINMTEISDFIYKELGYKILYEIKE